MIGFVLGIAILFALNFLPSPCEARVYAPPGGNRLTFLSGATAKVEWSFDNDISRVRYRVWHFTSSDGGSFNSETLADIAGNGNATILVNLPVVEIEKPATLVLKNVDRHYTGIYKFKIVAIDGGDESEVGVFIAEKPHVTFNCLSPITVNEGDDVTCVCRDDGGNPPANVTWYKDGVQIGETRKEEQTLTIRNVSETYSGTYTCVAQSPINTTDENSIKVKVRLNCKPNKTAIVFTPERAVVGESITITCESNGLPEPSYTIFHNDTEVSIDKTYTISKVKWSDAGSYKCIATNKLGNNSDSKDLTVEEIPEVSSTTHPPTIPSQKIATTTKGKRTEKVLSEESNNGTEWYIVVVILVSGIIIGILLSYIVSCSRRKFRSKKPQSQPEPSTSQVDTTYQELDLTKMNTEDNYQSLRVNAASNDAGNDNESTYTELNKTRDMENNYKSLT